MSQKILVIDDTPETARLAEAVLQKNFPGCDVLTATRGSEGFERFHVATPDLIVLAATLPDMDAEAVLERLGTDPVGAQVPVLILADSEDSQKFHGRFLNVVRVLKRPATSESLAEAFGAQLSNKAAARRVLQSHGGIAFSGHTGFISLRQALAMAQSDRLTGVLRFQLGKHPIELWMKGGRFLFATTRNFNLYCGGSPVILSSTNLGLIIEGQIHQQVTGCPIFLFLSTRHGLAHDDVMQITREHGQRLFGQLFTAGRVAFEFEEGEDFPEFARNLTPSNDDAENWVLGSLRYVRFEQLTAAQRPDPNGAPAYTRRGYELVQRLKLNEVEARFATAINGTDTLQAIAAHLDIPLHDALLIVYRFDALDVIDFWNPGVLSLPGAAE